MLKLMKLMMVYDVSTSRIWVRPFQCLRDLNTANNKIYKIYIYSAIFDNHNFDSLTINNTIKMSH